MISFTGRRKRIWRRHRSSESESSCGTGLWRYRDILRRKRIVTNPYHPPNKAAPQAHKIAAKRKDERGGSVSTTKLLF